MPDVAFLLLCKVDCEISGASAHISMAAVASSLALFTRAMHALGAWQ